MKDGKSQQMPEKHLGYRALIASGKIDFTKGTSNLSKEEDLEDGNAVHIDFLNKTFDLNDTSAAQPKVGIIKNAPSQLNFSKSPQSAL